jgi:hypothetical protein
MKPAPSARNTNRTRSAAKVDRGPNGRSTTPRPVGGRGRRRRPQPADRGRPRVGGRAAHPCRLFQHHARPPRGRLRQTARLRLRCLARAAQPAHRDLRIADGAVATSGITRRSWVDGDGRAAHQIIDPSTGRPAFTGVVQATAVAPTGLLAETLAKTALPVGPERAESQLAFGGVIVEDGGAVRVVEPLASLLPAVQAA